MFHITRQGGTPDPRVTQENSEYSRVETRSAEQISATPPTPTGKNPERRVVDDNGVVWIYDTVTEKYYQVQDLPRTDPELVKKMKHGVKSIETLRRNVELAENFDVDDLEGTASRFLANLRNPPSRERQVELLRAREQRGKN